MSSPSSQQPIRSPMWLYQSRLKIRIPCDRPRPTSRRVACRDLGPGRHRAGRGLACMARRRRDAQGRSAPNGLPQLRSLQMSMADPQCIVGELSRSRKSMRPSAGEQLPLRHLRRPRAQAGIPKRSRSGSADRGPGVAVGTRRCRQARLARTVCVPQAPVRGGARRQGSGLGDQRSRGLWRAALSHVLEGDSGPGSNGDASAGAVATPNGDPVGLRAP
jgi:hypothetical protein